MISWHDLYTVMCAVVPLYVAMILAYGSVRWWGVLTPDQCSGINRFVSVFAVPLLSFHCIAASNPYVMNLRFVAADTLQKVLVLAALAAWSCLPARGGGRAGRAPPIDWSITLFSLATLPNTLIMGLPLLVAMYGRYSGDLLVQVVVLQCIVWYTLLLVLFEFRAARVLIAGQCPGTAASIADVHVDPDVVSLAGSQAEAQAEVSPDGKTRLVVRRSTSRRSLAVAGTPRPSNLTGVEIYSVSSSRNATPRGSSFAHADDVYAAGFAPPPHSASTRVSSFGAADLFSLHSSRQHTPRASNFDEHAVRARSAAAVAPSCYDPKDMPTFEWSSSGASAASEVNGLPVFRGGDHRAKDVRRLVVPSEAPPVGLSRAMRPEERVGSFKAEAVQDALAKLESGSTEQRQNNVMKDAGGENGGAGAGGHLKAPAGVMMQLIVTMVWRRLIRNPNTYASLVGLTWSLISFRFQIAMPIIVKNSISILSDAGLGMAMFSLGLFMAMQPKIIACGNSVAAITMAIRFLFGPAVMAVTSAAVGLRGTLLCIAIVQAALPQGIVPFVFAKEYDLHAAILCTGYISQCKQIILVASS
ncbi:hypothetical protein PVAP13_3KG215600 [Panicum virgatum]|uniref:Auxin efflux carrier component n=1 Tax=Panicum virgatum TaxID=38727 RepID=A0A8T0UTG2_PANVG|nr:hypothetical protein PVAP13_3KG215600 [Panicum virgatum]